jgi:hypothetical protein
MGNFPPLIASICISGALTNGNMYWVKGVWKGKGAKGGIRARGNVQAAGGRGKVAKAIR